MPFDYAANVAAVRQCLADYNTATANPYLSQSLTTQIVSVLVDDPEVAGVQWTNHLPGVFIRIQTGEEEAASLGDTGPLARHVQKFKTVAYEIIGLYPRDGASAANADHMTEIYQFAENLEGVFQREFTLSGTALWCHPERTDFGAFQTPGGVRVKAFVTTLRARYMFR